MKREKLRYILQYHFDQGDNAGETAKRICEVYGPDTVTQITAQRWFRKFRSGKSDVEDNERSGRPSVKNVEEIFKMVESDRFASAYEISKKLKIDRRTVWSHLLKAGYKKEDDVWVKSVKRKSKKEKTSTST